MASQAPPPRASARMDEGSDVGDLMVSDYYMGQLLALHWVVPHLPQYRRYLRYRSTVPTVQGQGDVPSGVADHLLDRPTSLVG
jgi:hypothetical protein